MTLSGTRVLQNKIYNIGIDKDKQKRSFPAKDATGPRNFLNFWPANVLFPFSVEGQACTLAHIIKFLLPEKRSTRMHAANRLYRSVNDKSEENN